MKRPDHKFTQEWHVAINKHAEKIGFTEMRFMYEAKNVADEVPRLSMLFKMEREEGLAKTHKQCSFSKSEEVRDNHLTCCLGVKCAECPHLLALQKADLSDEDRDIAKAWTCATHIISKGGDAMGEGYILTVDDRMYWNNVYESLAQPLDEEQ